MLRKIGKQSVRIVYDVDRTFKENVLGIRIIYDYLKKNIEKCFQRKEEAKKEKGNENQELDTAFLFLTLKESDYRYRKTQEK